MNALKRRYMADEVM